MKKAAPGAAHEFPASFSFVQVEIWILQLIPSDSGRVEAPGLRRVIIIA